jgi:hypothetical protein
MFGNENQFRSVFAYLDVFGGEFQVEGRIDEVGWCMAEDADDCKEGGICDLRLLVLVPITGEPVTNHCQSHEVIICQHSFE